MYKGNPTFTKELLYLYRTSYVCKGSPIFVKGRPIIREVILYV